MKSIFFIITTLLFYSSSFAQETLVYSYQNKLCNDAIEKHILYLGEDYSYYQSLNALENRMYSNSMKKNKQPIKASELKDTNLKSVIKKEKDKLYRYEYFIMSKSKIKYDSSEICWVLVNETKKSDGNILHKAILNYGGREWVAWYNPAIPFQEGPYVFVGLPGLIEEVYDSEEIISFKFTGKSKETFAEDLFLIKREEKYSPMSFEKWNKFIQNVRLNPFKLVEMSGLALREISEEEKRDYNNDAQKKFDCIIERTKPTN